MPSTRSDFRTNLEALRAAQKPSFGTAAYSRLVNRPTGRYVAAWASARGMKPNQATAISATCSAAGMLLLALVSPHWWVGIAVAVLLAVGYVWDSVDGQIARLTGTGSKRGEWLDHTVDTVKTSALPMAVLINLYRWPAADSDLWLLVPIGFEIAAMTIYFGLMLMPTLRPPGSTSSVLDAGQSENALRKWLLLPIDYGFQCWLFVLLGWRAGFLAVYTVVFVCVTLAALAALRKWWRELSVIENHV